MLLHAESRDGRALLASAEPPAEAPDERPDVTGATTGAGRTRRPNRVAITNSYYRDYAAGELAVPGPGVGAKGKVDSVTFVQDAYRAFTVRRSGVAVYRGGAVRLAVTVSGTDISARVSLPMIAVQVEAGQLSAAYKFEVLGVGDMTDLADDLPLVGSFDTQAYVQLIEAANKCTRTLLRTELDPVDLYVEVTPPEIDDIVWTWANALKSLAAGTAPADLVNDPTRDRRDVHDWVVDGVRQLALAEDDPAAWASRRLENLRSNLGG